MFILLVSNLQPHMFTYPVYVTSYLIVSYYCQMVQVFYVLCLIAHFAFTVIWLLVMFL